MSLARSRGWRRSWGRPVWEARSRGSVLLQRLDELGVLTGPPRLLRCLGGHGLGGGFLLLCRTACCHFPAAFRTPFRLLVSCLLLLGDDVFLDLLLVKPQVPLRRDPLLGVVYVDARIPFKAELTSDLLQRLGILLVGPLGELVSQVNVIVLEAQFFW